MISPTLLKQTIESFPLADDVIHRGLSGLAEQDLKFAGELTQAMIECSEFHGMSAQLRESYFAHGMQIWAWVNIARCFMQIGYRLHSLEMTDSLK